jgi:hypothetical protein
MVASTTRSRFGGAVPGRVVFALALVFLLIGGCGGGGSTSTQQQFFFQVLGPAGGVASGGPVTVTFPPGALAQDTAVAVLPELTPLPIVPPAGDPCTYAYLGPIHCCGPLSLVLGISATLRVAYDENLIPAGQTENDLVLLLSDPATNNTVMVPKFAPSVTQFTISNFFEDTDYNPLGHVAIGIRTCPVGRIIVQNNQIAALTPKADVGVSANVIAQGGQPIVPEQLWLVDPEGVQGPAFVPTGNVPFNSFLATPAGDRVLLRVSDPRTEQSTLQTAPLPGGGVPTVVFETSFPTGFFMQDYDPHFGWLKGSPNEVFLQVFRAFSSPQGEAAPPPNEYQLQRRHAITLPAATVMRTRPSNTFYPEDMRQSGTGDALSLRWGVNFQTISEAAFPGSTVDVLTSPAGGVLSADLIPAGPAFGPSPRFMSQSPDLYVVTDSSTVTRYTRAGVNQGTLFNGAFKGEILVDFALAPDDETFAMIVDVPSFSEELTQQGPSSYVTELWMGTLEGGVDATFSFFSQQGVLELVWHPWQTGVFLQLSGWNPSFYRLEDGKGLFIAETELPSHSLTNIDVNRIDGRILACVRQFSDLTAGSVFYPPGLYVSAPDAQEFLSVPAEGLTNMQNARWLQSWRNQPGMDSPRVR